MRYVFAGLCMILLSGCTLLQPLPEPARREVVTAPDAPAPIGPYSQAIKIGNALYCSGQIGLSPTTGDLIIGDVKDETKQVLENLGAVLRAAGMSHGEVVKTTIFLTSMDDYKLVNEVYAEYFSASKPARETVQVARLPRDARVEISCIAVKLDQSQ
ncbi:MAG: putative aminoacrylate peracid reductase RutC [bacterium]|nr:putative aminoacrylate peracid reductase RutC [bacterium]